MLEALLENEPTGSRSAEVSEARLRGQEYLLARGLLRRQATGAIVDPAWTQFSSPTWWHYDVLRGSNTCAAPHERVAEAIELVVAKRDGDGRWPLENPHPGTTPVANDAGEGQPSRWNSLRA